MKKETTNHPLVDWERIIKVTELYTIGLVFHCPDSNISAVSLESFIHFDHDSTGEIFTET